MPETLKRSKRTINKFRQWFSFEEGIDITDEHAVLYRRNIVIKNIIFLSNLVYMFILFIITIDDPGQGGNLILTLISLPLTFMINHTLKKMIYDEKDNLIKQQIAMYMACFYMFLSAVLIYLKLKSGPDDFLSEAGYVLLYYAVVVVSLYQDKKLLTTVFKWMLVLITIIHFTLTYRIYSTYQDTDIQSFFQEFWRTKEFKDILLRTIIFIIFMIVVYSIVSIGQYMHEQRINELTKRRLVQKDFTDIVGDLFGVVLSSNVTFEDKRHVNLVSDIAEKIAGIFGLTPNQISEIKAYATCHVFGDGGLSLGEYANKTTFNEHDYLALKEKTEQGAKVVRRLQLARKAEDIARSHIEGDVDARFIDTMKLIQPKIESQIILLADLYVTLRGAQSFKRPYPHKMTMDVLQKEFHPYFDALLLERFTKWQQDFESLYNYY